MVSSWQVATSTSTGTTADVKTTLNGGNDLKLWSIGPGQFVGNVIWYRAATGAPTAGQADIEKTFIESSDVGGIAEKVYVMPTLNGVLSTTAETLEPICKPVPYNFYAAGGQNLTLSATSLITNTAAYRVGAGLELVSGEPKPQEMFYSSTTNETNSGTAAARVSLGTINLNTARGGTLRTAIIRLATGVITTAEALIGYGEIEGPQIDDGGTQKITFPMQPQAAPLLASAGGQLKATELDIPLKRHFGNPASFTIYYNQEEALTATGNAVPTLGYTKDDRA